MGCAGWVSIEDASDMLEGIHGWGRLVHVNGQTIGKGVCVVGAQLCAAVFVSGGRTMWRKILLELSGCGLWIHTLPWVDCCR